MSKFRWSSAGLSVLVLVALIVWLATGDIRSSEDSVPEPSNEGASGLPMVEVEQRHATTFEPAVRLQGQVEAWRRLEVSARLSGEVEQLDVELGDEVSRGDRLLVLSEDDRPAAVAGARARVRQLEAELAAADRLRSDRLVSESEKLRLESELAAARAELRQANLAMTYLEPRAPFDGVVNDRQVETGTLVQAGEPLVELVQVDPLKVSGFVPQQQVGQLAPGQPVTVSLLDGRELEGKLTFIASAADPETRSFRIEARVQNPDRLRIAGGSASVAIRQPSRQALYLSPALLSLGPDGRPGILHVNGDNRVSFSQVELLSVSTSGAWVSGIDFPVQLITRGGGFVAHGQEVLPIPADPEG
ncbi:efflux RND transporter periplasmic adaptor subunit [Marinobacter sp. AN1]|uniref:efflux RND transporter periplasmic adaptor subunit n=1 Tax=Marinobacter sp. AN1 TaxID=2886046 RepID=UPI00223271B5|nr:efflux RND transporter periplasmic adaptor subunit [Marinobacter sp. AN1]UZD67131.1 efflux RND transporter periplasmic adaptor subunit [Marinobacter sp. AN1]